MRGKTLFLFPMSVGDVVVSHNKNDGFILEMLRSGRLRVDFITGEVFSTRSNTPSKPIGSPTKKGYLRVALWRKGKSIAVMVHRIVWVAANGSPSDSAMQVNHKDGVKKHNWLSNLELQTNRGNLQHASRIGLPLGAKGERCRHAKLTGEKVLQLRRDADSGLGYKELARKYGVSWGAVYNIIRRDSWKHIV